MKLQTLPTQGIDTPEQRRRLVETVNNLISFISGLSAGQVAYASDPDGKLVGSPELLWNGTVLTIGVTQNGILVLGTTADSSNDISSEGSISVSAGPEGFVNLFAGIAQEDGQAGGRAQVIGGPGIAGDGNAGDVLVAGGNTQSPNTGDAGDVVLQGGASDSGAHGSVIINTGPAPSTERIRIDADGALLLSGDPGSVGQVLTSNGPGAPPTWETP